MTEGGEEGKNVQNRKLHKGEKKKLHCSIQLMPVKEGKKSK
jgi:hypothetical protein